MSQRPLAPLSRGGMNERTSMGPRSLRRHRITAVRPIMIVKAIVQNTNLEQLSSTRAGRGRLRNTIYHEKHTFTIQTTRTRHRASWHVEAC
eukprot:1633376-Pyramimonas_sp.AAC.1